MAKGLMTILFYIGIPIFIFAFILGCITATNINSKKPEYVITELCSGKDCDVFQKSINDLQSKITDCNNNLESCNGNIDVCSNQLLNQLTEKNNEINGLKIIVYKFIPEEVNCIINSTEINITIAGKQINISAGNNTIKINDSLNIDEKFNLFKQLKEQGCHLEW